MENLNAIIESLLFVAEEPLTVDSLRNVLGDVTSADIRSALTELVDAYSAKRGGFYLSEVAGGYQFRSRSEFNVWIRKLIQPNAPRLSKAALETLAIVAYKQPLIRSDIEHIRGVDCGGVLRALLERKLIRILGRKEIPGRPLIYATTKLFLQVFDLRDLKDLPSPKEIESMALEAPPPAHPDSGDISETAPPDGESDGEAPDREIESMSPEAPPPDQPVSAENSEATVPDGESDGAVPDAADGEKIT